MKRVLVLLIFSMVFGGLVACSDGQGSHLNESDEPNTTPMSAPVRPGSCSAVENKGENGEWMPIFCEEFNGSNIDTTVWNFETGGNGWGNNEEQYYTSMDNAEIIDGNLVITARKTTEESIAYDYTSARMTTANKFAFKYGRVDVRAKLPTAGGTWPAIWMMPNDSSYGGWPKSGEIDIMEHIGNNLNNVMGTIHTSKYYWENGNQIGSGYKKPTPTFSVADYHEYSIIWDEYNITWLVDDKVLYSTSQTTKLNPKVNSDVDPSAYWPFDKEFFIILNIALGGNMGGTIAEDFIEDQMTVDYVRVYQQDKVSSDKENPTAVGDIELMTVTHNSAYFTWGKASDDIGVKGYNLYLNGKYNCYMERNACRIWRLVPKTDYTLSIVAIDYSGKMGEVKTFEFRTNDYKVANERIEAEDYDGGSGFQVQACQDAGGGKNIGYIEKGAALSYIVRVPESGVYDLYYRAAAEAEGGIIRLTIDGEDTDAEIPATGGWQVWETVNAGSVTLSEGVITLRLRVREEGFNLNYFSLIKRD